MSKLNLVIFDCDGVMFDSRNANRRYYNHLLEKFGHPSMTEEEVDYVHIHHVTDSVTHIFKHYPEDIEKVEEYRAAIDYTPFLQYMIMEPDLIEFLEFLRPDYRTAISTNRTTTMPAVLEMFDLKRHFEKIVTALDVDRPKPHPEALHQILDFFGLSVEDAIYIGDSMVDREHTATIGMRLIAFKNPDLPAEYHVNRFMEITRLLSDL
ncbi:MAG: HAD hydrolase-like protein [Thermodesulfobacteriota bacterium]|nr:HAD hydrolase-like protein [Thermodesulfobacteriota bacterium]